MATKTTTKAKSKTEVKNAKTPVADFYNEIGVHKCFMCGNLYDNPKDNFYRSMTSKYFKNNDNFIPWCTKCINEVFEQHSERYGTEIATLLLCSHLDIPFSYELFRSLHGKTNNFSFGKYLRTVSNLGKNKTKTFDNTLLSDELKKNSGDIRDEQENKWSRQEKRNKEKILDLVGYDPFECYNDVDRKYLFNELINYFDDDLEDDRYKLTQIIQIVINNVQIRNCDINISKLNPLKDAKAIKDLNDVKKDLVKNNDIIAKENEISVKNRSNKNAGKSTFTYYMRDLRERNFDDAEVDYYNQLRSAGTKWAVDISTQSILKNGFFDENDRGEIYEENLKLVQTLYDKLDDAEEEIRQLKIKINEYEYEYQSYNQDKPKKQSSSAKSTKNEDDETKEPQETNNNSSYDDEEEYNFPTKTFLDELEEDGVLDEIDNQDEISRLSTDVDDGENDESTNGDA